MRRAAHPAHPPGELSPQVLPALKTSGARAPQTHRELQGACVLSVARPGDKHRGNRVTGAQTWCRRGSPTPLPGWPEWQAWNLTPVSGPDGASLGGGALALCLAPAPQCLQETLWPVAPTPAGLALVARGTAFRGPGVPWTGTAGKAVPGRLAPQGNAHSADGNTSRPSVKEAHSLGLGHLHAPPASLQVAGISWKGA